MKKEILLLLLCFLARNKISAQHDVFFIKHLSELELQKEHFQYLKENHKENDSSYYFEAKFNLQYGLDSLFFDCILKSKTLAFNDSLLLNFASCHFLHTTNNKTREFWFDSILPLSKKENEGIQKYYFFTKNPRTVNLDEIPNFLQEDFIKYQKASKKKPIISALLSAIIPGSGKLYIGNKRSFFATFISLAGFSTQAIEAISKKGVSHPLSVVNLGFFSGFYFVNVHGSYRETKLKKVNLKNQFLINVSNYYCSSPCKLY